MKYILNIEIPLADNKSQELHEAQNLTDSEFEQMIEDLLYHKDSEIQLFYSITNNENNN